MRTAAAHCTNSTTRLTGNVSQTRSNTSSTYTEASSNMLSAQSASPLCQALLLPRFCQAWYWHANKVAKQRAQTARRRRHQKSSTSTGMAAARIDKDGWATHTYGARTDTQLSARLVLMCDRLQCISPLLLSSLAAVWDCLAWTGPLYPLHKVYVTKEPAGTHTPPGLGLTTTNSASMPHNRCQSTPYRRAIHSTPFKTLTQKTSTAAHFAGQNQHTHQGSCPLHPPPRPPPCRPKRTS
jgi:hypothetical protein